MAITSFKHFNHISVIIYTTILIFYSTLVLAKNPQPFKKIYAFGDSFTDTGNTKSETGPTGFGHLSNPPYGMTYFHHPTNRYSDGRLVIDLVAQKLGLPFLPPYLKTKNKVSTNGVNFAVAGSTAIKHAFFVKNNLSLDIIPESIETQLVWFNNYLTSQYKCNGTCYCRAAFDDSLIWVGEIGANDYAYSLGSDISRDRIRALAIGTLTKFLESLLNKGVKHVVVQGLPLLGCLPLAMYVSNEHDRDELGCVKSLNNQSYIQNEIYQAKLELLRKQFPKTMIVYLDYWNAYRAVMQKPAYYGFKEPFLACCGSGGPPYNFNVFETCGSSSATACHNPSKYINWDGVHLTEAMYKVLTDMFLNGSYSHPSFDYLFR